MICETLTSELGLWAEANVMGCAYPALESELGQLMSAVIKSEEELEMAAKWKLRQDSR